MTDFISIRFRIVISLLVFSAFISMLIPLGEGVKAEIKVQIPTGSIPTVTSSPMGATVTVKRTGEQDYIHVRSGPETVGYDIIGLLIVGQTVPALGRTPGGDWVKIIYPGAEDGVGWVYAYLVDVGGSLSIVEPPPTSTPRATPTIDPTLASQFIIEIQPTRLPTYTAPEPYIQATFPADNSGPGGDRLPFGFVIVGMTILGGLGLAISILRGR